MPFCRHRCGYCNFSVVADRDDLINRYLIAIDREIAATSTVSDRTDLDTVFIGGGTPTHLPPEAFRRLLESLSRRFAINERTEFSCEANPEDIDDEKLALMADCGVNRLSLGVQSFRDSKLQTLERGHRGSSAAEIVAKVASVIPNVSIDLIFGSPGETLADWNRDLEIACSLPITHVSTYALTYEKGTSFWTRRMRGGLREVDEETEIAMYDLARRHFRDAGFQHYEISSFAKPGYRCRHNHAYWRGDPWYGFGPGAAAFLGDSRTVNHRSTTTYLRRMENAQSPVAETEPVPPLERVRERVAFGVRMIDGIDLEAIGQPAGVDPVELFRDEIADLERKRLVSRHGNHIRLTEQGVHFADTVAAAFLSSGS